MISAKCEKKNVYVVDTKRSKWCKTEVKALKQAKAVVRSDLEHELRWTIIPCIEQFDKRRREYIIAEEKLSDIELAKQIHKIYERYKEYI